MVVERIVATKGLRPETPSQHEAAFFASLRLADQPRQNLFALYEGWITCVEALAAARLSGAFAINEEGAAIARRRGALDAHARLTREIAVLLSKAKKEKQMSRRVYLNLEIQRLEAELGQQKSYL